MAVVRVCAVRERGQRQACAGCRSCNCSRARQVRHWAAHKALPTEISVARWARRAERAGETSATFDKFLVNFLSIHEHCEEAVRLGAVLPIVHIKTGTTGANHVVSFPGPKTMSAARCRKNTGSLSGFLSGWTTTWNPVYARRGRHRARHGGLAGAAAGHSVKREPRGGVRGATKVAGCARRSAAPAPPWRGTGAAVADRLVVRVVVARVQATYRERVGSMP